MVERLINLLFQERPELISAPLVEDINPKGFEGPALVVMRTIPPWADPVDAQSMGLPYAASIHAYINEAGLSAERFQPTEAECELHRLTPGETVFIVTQPA